MTINITIIWRDMRYFFIFGALAFALTPVCADELRDIRDALNREEYASVSEQLLDYLGRFPEDTEFVEQVISSIKFQLERQRVDVDRFIQQIESDPDDIEALQRAAVAMEKSGGVFGIDLEINTDALLDISLASKEYNELDVILGKIKRARDARQFASVAALIADALNVGRDRFVVVSGGQAQTDATEIAAEVLAISERLRTLYDKQLLPVVRRAKSVIGSNRASDIEQVADEIDSVGQEFRALRADTDLIASRIRVLQQSNEERITYPELLRRIVEKDYYNTLSLANIIEYAIEYEMETVLKEYEAEFQRRFRNTRTSMNNLRIASASFESMLARSIAELLVRNVQFVIPIENPLTTSAIENRIASNSQQAAMLLNYYSSQSAIDFLHQMISASTAFVSVGDGDAELESINANQLLNNQSAIYQRYLAAWRTTESEIVALNQRINSSIVNRITNETNATAESFIAAGSERSTRLYNRYFADIVEQYRSLVEKPDEIIDTVRSLVYGDSDSARTSGIELVDRYPQEAIPALSEAIRSIDEALDALLGFEPLYRSLQSVPTINIDNAFEDLLERAVNVGNRLRSLQADAEQNIAEAARLRANGDRARLQTEAALNRNDGRQANQLWTQARANYLDSLALREDKQFREEIEQVSVAIRDRILEIEHAEVVREVRDLINRSRRAVAIQDIDEAYSLIERSAELWAITNVEQNPEVVRQQEYIELVLTFEQTYNLITTDPLYGVLGGYLSSVAKNIGRINQLIDQGNTVEAGSLIVETKRTIQNVIDVQPFNTEARTLNLRLIAATDPDELQRILDELFESASRTAVREPRLSLSDFYTIRALRATYPGVEQQIAELETALGLRIAQLSTDDQQQAGRLLAQAQELIRTGDRNRITAAGTLLQEALVIDPNNSTAQAALDQLRINSGSSAQASLSANDEQLLRRAETLFVQGNIAQTFAILENLWRASPNRNYPPLIALRNQVISRLGI